MDRIHLPAIVKLRAPFEGGRGLAKKDVGTTEGAATRTTNRARRKGAKDKTTGVNLDQDTAVTRKKIGNILAEKQRRLQSTKFTVSGGKIKSNSRSEGKHARRRTDAAIGLPNISLSIGGSAGRNNSDAERTTAKKAKRCRVRHGGDTISYVYSKSLKDENCMAFLRNCNTVEFDKGVRSDQRSSESDCVIIDEKKPYGLPSLTANVECIADHDRREWVSATIGQGSLANGESLLNKWEVDDGVSNATNYDSSDSLADNE